MRPCPYSKTNILQFLMGVWGNAHMLFFFYLAAFSMNIRYIFCHRIPYMKVFVPNFDMGNLCNIYMPNVDDYIIGLGEEFFLGDFGYAPTNVLSIIIFSCILGHFLRISDTLLQNSYNGSGVFYYNYFHTFFFTSPF